MSKQIRTLIILLICVVVLGGGFYLAVKFIIPPKDSAGKIPLFTTERDKIASINVTGSKGNYELVKSGDKWQIKGHESIPIDSNNISVLLLQLKSIAATKIVEKNPSDISKYGFSSPLAKVTINLADGKKFYYEIGMQSPTSSGYYLKRENDTAVYMATDDLGKASINGATQVIDKLLFTLVPYDKFTEVNYLKISGENRGQYPINMYLKSNLTDTSVANVFELRGNYSYDIGIEEGEGILKQAFSISQADSAVAYDPDAKTLAEYGFDKPSYVMEFSFQNNPCKIKFGRKADDGSYYAMLDGRNVIYSYTGDRLTFLDTKAKDIIERMVMLRSINVLDTITVITGGKEYSFSVKGENKDLKAYNGLREIDADNFKQFYQVILQVRYEDLIAEPKGVEPALTINYKFRDGTEEKLEFIPADSRKCFVRINGKGDFYVIKTDVDEIAADVIKVVKGEKVTTEW